MSSDYSPTLITLSSRVHEKTIKCKLHNYKTSWILFRESVENSLDTEIVLKNDDDIFVAVQKFNDCVQQAAWISTPTCSNSNLAPQCSLIVKEIMAKKRTIHKLWQQTRHPMHKKWLNFITKRLKNTLDGERNEAIQEYLRNLDASDATDYSLWKATKKIKQL